VAAVSHLSAPGGQRRHALLGDQPLEPLSVRLLQAAGALSLLLVLVVVNSLLNPSGGESPFDPNPVAAAAERTKEAPGMHFSMTAAYSSESMPRTVAHGGGAYNADSGLVQVQLRAPVAERGTVDVEVVGNEDSMYLHSPEFAGQLPEGKEWIEVNPDLAQSEESAMAGESFDNSLRMLAASGGVRRIGHARIRGAQTTRYRVSVEAPEVPNVLGPIRAEAFVDDHGMLRRARTVVTTTTDGAPLTVDMQMDLFDFGAEPDIQTPDDSLVYDMTPLLEEGLDALEQSS
jgi:hypothetical protein